VIVFFAFVAHGIIRHRLMNLRFVIHNWLTSWIASIVAVLPLLLIATHEAERRQAWDASSFALLLVAGLLGPPLWTRTQYFLHQYVYRGDADFRTLISEASGRLAQVLAPAETATVVSDTIFTAVRPEGVAVYAVRDIDQQITLIHSRQTERLFATPEVLPASVVSDLGVRLLASPQVVPVDGGRSQSAQTSTILEENHWALIIPLSTEAQPIGAIAVGEKLSGDPYYLEDVRLLQVLGNQATVALKNAQLYERVLLSNQHIENIVATVQSGIIVYDRFKVRVMNEAALHLLGLDSSIGVPATIPARELPLPIAELLDRTLESGSPARTADVTIQRTEGPLSIMCSTTPLRSADGEVVGAVAALSDLSTLKALEMERARGERLNYFEALASALAHEIANPIAPIKLMTQMLPTRHRDEAFIRDFTRIVIREISRMQKLVDRLRRLSRPASSQRVVVDLRTVLRDAVDVVQPLLEEGQISFELIVCEESLLIQGDSSELQELFLNLLTNAVEATPPNGRVVAEAACESTEAYVRIEDNGPGISPEITERIFEPFVSSKERGSGLGLTICDGILKRHQGTITTRSTKDGASFTVRLPLAELGRLGGGLLP
jgi:signal transduction histidine kinase